MKLHFNLKNYFCPGLNFGQIQARPRPGQARLRRAWIDHVRVYVYGPTSTKIDFLLKNGVFRLFGSFWGLLDLKNGSGSKFRLKWWYREVWNHKIKPFRDKLVIENCWSQFLCENCPGLFSRIWPGQISKKNAVYGQNVSRLENLALTITITGMAKFGKK